MRRFARLFLTAVTLATGLAAFAPRDARASGVVLGLRLGGPVYYPRPVYYGSYYYPYYYRPAVVIQAPVIVEPAPVVVQPAPVVVQPAPVVTQPAPARQIVTTSSPVSTASAEEVTRHYQLLSHADDKVRAEAAMELGRLRADRAIDALAAVMAQDRSPQVRESAARALGLIGSQRALPALRTTGLSDADRDVRRSAQFSIEVIHSHLKGQ